MPGRHCLWRVELYGISFLYFSSLERRIGTKGELSSESKRRRAAAEGTMALRCRLLLGQNFVIPTQSINIRLFRGKMGREVLSTSQCQGQSDQAMTCGVHMRNGGLSSLCAWPTSAWMGRGWDVLVHPRLVGLFVDLSKPQQTAAEPGQYVCVSGHVQTVSNSSKHQSKQIQERASWGSSSLAWWTLTKDGVGWTDRFSGAVTSRDVVTLLKWVWLPVITAMIGAGCLLYQLGQDRACWG